MKISKTFHRSKGRDIITSPKTVKSNRIIKMPLFLCESMKEYMAMFYNLQPEREFFLLPNRIWITNFGEEQKKPD